MRFSFRKSRPLREHQERALAYMRGQEHPALVCEMRTGKNLMVIRWVQELGLRTVLIVAPVEPLGAWQDELEREGEHFSTAQGKTAARRLQIAHRAFVEGERERRWVLTSYESLLSTPLYAKLAWDLVCLDESRKISNVRAQISKLCCSGFRLAKRRAILTGLIAPETDLEVFQQFKFLDGEFMGHRDYWSFQHALFEKDPNDYSGYGWKHKRGAKVAIKEAVHSRAFVLPRSEANMPDRKVYEPRYVEMEKEQRRIYGEIVKDYAAELQGGAVETQWAVTRQLWLAKLAGGFDPENRMLSDRKARDILRLLKGDLKAERVVIWFRFRHELLFMQELLDYQMIQRESIMGGGVFLQRKAAIERFQKGKVQVLLATEKVVKYGVDCSIADTAIYYSNEYSCEDRTQSEDRIVHPNKDVDLLYLDMVTRDTIDEDVYAAVRSKKIDAKMLMKRFEKSLFLKENQL